MTRTHFPTIYSWIQKWWLNNNALTVWPMLRANRKYRFAWWSFNVRLRSNITYICYSKNDIQMWSGWTEMKCMKHLSTHRHTLRGGRKAGQIFNIIMNILNWPLCGECSAANWLFLWLTTDESATKACRINHRWRYASGRSSGKAPGNCDGHFVSREIRAAQQNGWWLPRHPALCIHCRISSNMHWMANEDVVRTGGCTWKLLSAIWNKKRTATNNAFVFGRRNGQMTRSMLFLGLNERW